MDPVDLIIGLMMIFAFALIFFVLYQIEQANKDGYADGYEDGYADALRKAGNHGNRC